MHALAESSGPRPWLDPIGSLYGAIAARRRTWFETADWRRRRLRRPVISVGNLALGGRGKTPLVRHVAGLLRDAGERPCILSRGYARRDARDGVVIVSDGSHLCADLDRAGDEPLMLARSLDGVAVLVAPDRYLAGRLAEGRLGATVHLLDDGFQHVGLRRDLDLLLVTAGDLQNGRVVPGGRLREHVAAAAHADVWLCPPADLEIVGDLARRAGVSRVFAAMGQAGALRAVDPSAAPFDVTSRRVVAVAGIARPERFFDALRDAGLEVAAARAWPDHHVFTDADTALVRQLMERTGAGLAVTTEKDAVRWLAHRPLPFRLAWLPWSMTAAPADEFRDWLLEAVARAKDARR